jgi:hypothetical protein
MFSTKSAFDYHYPRFLERRIEQRVDSTEEKLATDATSIGFCTAEFRDRQCMLRPPADIRAARKK